MTVKIEEMRRRMDDLLAEVENLESDVRPAKIVSTLRKVVEVQRDIAEVVDQNSARLDTIEENC